MPEFLDWLRGALSWLVEQPEWAWDELSAATRAAIVLAVLAIALGLTVRKLRLRWLARSPRVQITEFTWTGVEEKGRDGIWATSLFREQLSLLQTDPLDPLPERSPSAPLVDIVEGVSQGVTQKADFGKMAGRLFRAVWPAAAYEVWGTLRPLESGEDRVSVQLVDRARRNRTLVSDAFADDNWSRGARRAAMAVAGGLYPKIAKKRRGPWTGWRDAVPERLLSHYHEAQEHETENRLAQAMGAYHKALREDPLNPELRLKIAMLQERLALDLDAWVTYLAIVDEVDRKAWRGRERHTRLIAQYRLAILLGNGRIATQWQETTDGQTPTLRDEERARRREELVIALKRDPMLTDGLPIRTPWRRYVSTSPAASLLDCLLPCRARGLRRTNSRTSAVRTWIGEVFSLPGESTPPAVDSTPQPLPNMDLVLKLMSLKRLEDLDAWLRLRPPYWRLQWRAWRLCRPPLRQWLTRRDLSRCMVRVSKRLARIHIEGGLRRYQEESRRVLGLGLRSESLTHDWPFPRVGFDPLRQLARWVAPRRRWANGRADAWQFHYNAACTIAVCLSRSTQPDHRERLVAAMIDEFEQYAHRAGTDRVAAQADWIAFDDPDLKGIDHVPAFKQWMSHHVPRKPPEVRPPRSVDIEHYAVRVLHDAARVFASTWMERAENGAVEAATNARWWRIEQDAWQRLAEACHERHSWHHRLKSLEALQQWLNSSEAKIEIDLGHADRDEVVESPEVTEGLLDALATVAGAREGGASNDSPPSDTVQYWAQARSNSVQAEYETNGTASRLRLRCRPRTASDRHEALRAARVWTRLADVLKEEMNRPPGSTETLDLSACLNPIRKELPTSG